MGFESFRSVCCHGLRRDPNGTVQSVLVGEFLGTNDRRRRATGWRTGHELGHDAGPDDLGGHDIFRRHLLPEQGNRILRSMSAGLGADFCEGFQGGAELVHMRLARTAEVPQRQRDLGTANQFVGFSVECRKRADPVMEHRTDCAGLHLFEPKCQSTFDRAAFNCLPGQEQGGRSGRAVVVHIQNRDACHSDMVQGALTAGAVAIDIANIGLLDFIIIQPRVCQSGPGRSGRHHIVAFGFSRLLERDHPNACNIGFVCHFSLSQVRSGHPNRSASLFSTIC